MRQQLEEEEEGERKERRVAARRDPREQGGRAGWVGKRGKSEAGGRRRKVGIDAAVFRGRRCPRSGSRAGAPAGEMIAELVSSALGLALYLNTLGADFCYDDR